MHLAVTCRSALHHCKVIRQNLHVLVTALDRGLPVVHLAVQGQADLLSCRLLHWGVSVEQLPVPLSCNVLRPQVHRVPTMQTQMPLSVCICSTITR